MTSDTTERYTAIKTRQLMNYVFTLFVLFTVELTFAQSSYPDFLQGTWKMENEAVFEHWDRLNETTLKGFSYELKDGQMFVSEYLDITAFGNEIIYTATVLKQNEAQGVRFTLTKTDSTFTFENPNHDFPKKIVYQQLSDTEIFVRVSDGKAKAFAYKMEKQFQHAELNDSTVSNPNYDKSLADKLGGDAYGMKRYFLVVLKMDANKTTDKELLDTCFRGHLDNINRLVAEGILIVAGPLGKNASNYTGIFILDKVKTIEEVEELLQTDLAVKHGLLDYEVFTWYGSAALPEYLPFSDKIWKSKP